MNELSRRKFLELMEAVALGAPLLAGSATSQAPAAPQATGSEAPAATPALPKAELGDLRPCRRRAVRWRRNAAGLMELRDAQASPRWIELNAAASSIWELCDGLRTVNAVARAMAVRLGAPPAAAQRLTRDFVTLLHDYGLLEYRELRSVYRAEYVKAPDHDGQENR